MLHPNSYNKSVCRYLNLMILGGFITVLLVVFTGCGAIYNAQMHEMGKIQFGVASWYSNSFDGGKTSSGEIYDKDSFTAAHRTLPFGTIIKVTNIKNGRSAYVRVNDRGPHKASRKIDMSYASAKKIGMINDGVARVRLEVMDDKFAVKLYEQQEKFWQIENTGETETAYNIQRTLMKQFLSNDNNKIANLDINKIPLGIIDDADDPPVMVVQEPSGSNLAR